MYIVLTAAFENDEQNFEELGILPTKHDMDNAVWDELWVQHDAIEYMALNDAGTTNIYLKTGGKWSVQETPEQIDRMIKKLSILVMRN